MDHTKAILFYFLLADYAKATCIWKIKIKKEKKKKKCFEIPKQ